MLLLNSKTTKHATNEALLEARDTMYATLKAYAKHHKKTTILLKCNMPGATKNTWYTAVVLRIFDKLINQLLSPFSREYYDSFAGNYTLFSIDQEAHDVKHLALMLEHEHPLGRYIDIDVYDRGKAVTREEYHYEHRPCFLCDGVAHECARSQRHTTEALTTHIKESVKAYLSQALTHVVMHAMRKEVYLYPKFGLVSNRDSGAHHDMKIDHFLASIKALEPYLKVFLEAGFDESIDLEGLRKVGQEAEEAMYEATRHINTHKGAIFIYGAFLPYFIRGIVHQDTLPGIMAVMAQAVEEVTKHDFDYLKDKKVLTPGEIIYQKYGLKGIRSEVAKGFPSVMNWYPNASYNDYQKLCAIMARLDDTTIIKRHNYTMLRNVKEEMSVLLKEEPFNFSTYKVLSNQYKAKGISPGGAADLLSLVFFLDQAKHLLNT